MLENTSCSKSVHFCYMSGKIIIKIEQNKTRLISQNQNKQKNMKHKQYIEPSPAPAVLSKKAQTVVGAQTDLLRFITSGSVDDGKSTLIGRLMYDTKSIFEDQLEAIELSSKRRGDEQVNLALLTDGLKAEREQGITIDVAYRYFSTPKRKFIMADTPGHIEYTRNMFTGASTAELSIILIDARHGVVEQTRRHTHIASLLGIRHILVAINKMDLVDYSQEVFEKIKGEYTEFVNSLQVSGASLTSNSHGPSRALNLHFIPISALNGDNVVNISKHTPWYIGKTVLETLETVEVEGLSSALTHGRFPVQRVIRPQSAEYPDFRGYAGRVEGGVFHPGDSVTILPSGIVSKIEKIFKYKTELSETRSGESIVITLTDNVDISRGDMIVGSVDIGVDAKDSAGDAHGAPKVSNEFSLTINWFNEKSLDMNANYILKHTTHETKARVISVGVAGVGATVVGKNDIVDVTIKTAKPIFYDPYVQNRVTGSVILIDEFTNETVAAGVIL